MKNRFRVLSESRKLEMLQMSVEEIYDAGYVTGYTNGAFNKLQNQSAEVKPKSPNQRRAELIQRAMEFVKGQNNSYVEGCCIYEGNTCLPVFIINVEKRTVVCLLKGNTSGTIYTRGIAKCMPGEVFNADIGKAIALARALEIEIPQEFLKALQPDEIVSGMVIEHAGALFTTTEHTGRCRFASTAKIIDDSNAEYEVPSC